ncbi:hypothetical protein BKA61DRAFT_734859 [Leptodontidium sp. MPI-SDFR-AT-0119]|nr:hypothetical protein BKA61DRAFT_734859 [Leptodontidium sp. MPI-SDFR-AT-0119]
MENNDEAQEQPNDTEYSYPSDHMSLTPSGNWDDPTSAQLGIVVEGKTDFAPLLDGDDMLMEEPRCCVGRKRLTRDVDDDNEVEVPGPSTRRDVTKGKRPAATLDDYSTKARGRRLKISSSEFAENDDADDELERPTTTTPSRIQSASTVLSDPNNADVERGSRPPRRRPTLSTSPIPMPQDQMSKTRMAGYNKKQGSQQEDEDEAAQDLSKESKMSAVGCDDDTNSQISTNHKSDPLGGNLVEGEIGSSTLGPMEDFKVILDKATAKALRALPIRNQRFEP